MGYKDASQVPDSMVTCDLHVTPPPRSLSPGPFCLGEAIALHTAGPGPDIRCSLLFRKASGSWTLSKWEEERSGSPRILLWRSNSLHHCSNSVLRTLWLSSWAGGRASPAVFYVLSASPLLLFLACGLCVCVINRKIATSQLSLIFSNKLEKP